MAAHATKSFKTIEEDEINHRVLAKACEIIGVSTELIPSLKITSLSEDGDLAMIGADRDAELTDPESRAVRGVVVDLRNNLVVSRTSYYAISCKQSPNAPLFTPKEGGDGIETITVELDNEQVRELPFDECIIVPHTEGVRLNVMLHGGRVYIMTNTNLFAEGTAESSAPGWRPGTPAFIYQFKATFLDLDNLKKSLYPEDADFSPWIYSFYVVHPARALTSKLLMGDDGFVIYYGAKQMWDIDGPNAPFKWRPEDLANEEDTRPIMGTPHFDPYDMSEYTSPLDQFDKYPRIPYELMGQVEKPKRFLVIPPGDLLQMTLTNVEAQDVLDYGLPNPIPSYRDYIDVARQTQDVRLLPGESFMILYVPREGMPERFHLKSNSYLYRAEVNQDTPKSDFAINMYLSFILFLKNAYLNVRRSSGLKEFLQKVPPVRAPPRLSILGLLEKGETLTSGKLYSSRELAKFNRGQLLHIVSYVYILVANGHNQLMAYRFFDRYIQDMNNVITWTIKERNNDRIYTTDRAGKPLAETRAKAYSFLRNIIAETKKMANAEAKAKTLPANPKTHRPITVHERQNQLIRTRIMSYNGMTFYNMVMFVSSMTGKTTTQISDPSYTAPPVREARSPKLESRQVRILKKAASVIDGHPEEPTEHVDVESLIEEELNAAVPSDALEEPTLESGPIEDHAASSSSRARSPSPPRRSSSRRAPTFSTQDIEDMLEGIEL